MSVWGGPSIGLSATLLRVLILSVKYTYLYLLWNEDRTYPQEREIGIMWIKDAMAGAGLILFMVSAFVLASGAQAVLNHIPA
jgi:hypothetical protein